MPRLSRPTWLPANKSSARWGAGVEFDCPLGCCRVRVWFENPADGLKGSAAPVGARLYEREGTGLGTITVVDLLDLGGHGAYWLQDGDLQCASRRESASTT